MCLHRRQTAWGIVGERKSAGSVSACSNFLLRKRKSQDPISAQQNRVDDTKHGKTRDHTNFIVKFQGGKGKVEIAGNVK